MEKTILYLFTLMACYNLSGQVTLPYNTGFENDSEKEFWKEYQLGTSAFGEWTYAASNGNLEPACISHDYSPATGGTLNDNWFVSPSFNIENGGKLDSISYKFTGFSTPEDGDTIGVYLLQGNQNPDLASNIIQLIDFRGTKVTNDNSYRTDTALNLESFDGESYIAIRYRNTDCSSKWLSVYFDDIFISKNPEIISNIISFEKKISIFPNPATNRIFLKNITINSLVEIYNSNGQKIIPNITIDKNNSIDVSNLSRGIYVLKITNKQKSFSTKLLIK